MSDFNPKVKALELAQLGGGTAAEVVARANVYNAFLSGTAAPANPANPKAGAATPPAAGKGANATGPKAPAAGANPKAAGSPKAAAAGANSKANGATAPKANGAAKAGAANAQAVPGDTKAPGGANTYNDVVAALCRVREKINKDEALSILSTDGGGVKSVRDLKPALYDAVVEGCNAALSDEGAPADTGAEFDTGTEQPATDELGLPG